MEREEVISFRVYLRVRPAVGREAKTQSALNVNNQTVQVKEQRGSRIKQLNFAFDGIFASPQTNLDVYKGAVQELVESVLSGFNATCFAYGNTGAGKTYTMMGSSTLPNATEPGVLMYALQACQQSLQQTNCTVYLSYLEIYNEHIQDLLGNSKDLMVLEDPIKGTVVPELTETQVQSVHDAIEIIEQGGRRRTMAHTGANVYSTRSHAILMVMIYQADQLFGKLSLIDLAGSERAAGSDNRGQRMVEGANINRSLLALGSCINVLSDPKKRGQYVPYRNSKLTRLLKDSLGGNTKTVMIACVGPSMVSIEETLNTLKYAERARLIKKKVRPNVQQERAIEYKDIITSLKAEIDHLKVQLKVSALESAMEISNELDKSEAERKLLKEEVIQLKETDSQVQELTQQVKNNFEEYWDLRHEINEIELLNKMNQRKVSMLIEYLKKQYQKNDLEKIEQAKLDINNIQENIRENEEHRNYLRNCLYSNIKQKTELQAGFSEMSRDKQRDAIELQIAIRNLKLEKLDLHIQNLHYKQAAILAQHECKQKDKMIDQISKELHDVKRQLQGKDYEENSFTLSSVPDEDEYVEALINLHQLTNQTQQNDSSILSNESILRHSPVTERSQRNLLQQAREFKKGFNKNIENPMRNTVSFLERYTPVSDKTVSKQQRDNFQKAKLRASSVTGNRQASGKKPKITKVSLVNHALRGAFSNHYKPPNNTDRKVVKAPRRLSVSRKSVRPKDSSQKFAPGSRLEGVSKKRVLNSQEENPRQLLSQKNKKPTRVKPAASITISLNKQSCRFIVINQKLQHQECRQD